MSSSGGGAGGSGGGDERRYDRNLQGLLQLTTSHTNPENTSNTNAVLDPENEPLHCDKARANQDAALGVLGLYRYPIAGDGNCLFRAVASQIGLEQKDNHKLREASVKWMEKHQEELESWGLVDGQEIKEVREDGGWPGQAAIVALANLLGANMAVLQGGDHGNLDIQHISPFDIKVGEDLGKNGSILLAYLYNGHYDAVVDKPNVPNPEYAAWCAQRKAEQEADAKLAKRLSEEDDSGGYTCTGKLQHILTNNKTNIKNNGDMSGKNKTINNNKNNGDNNRMKAAERSEVKTHVKLPTEKENIERRRLMDNDQASEELAKKLALEDFEASRIEQEGAHKKTLLKTSPTNHNNNPLKTVSTSGKSSPTQSIPDRTAQAQSKTSAQIVNNKGENVRHVSNVKVEYSGSPGVNDNAARNPQKPRLVDTSDHKCCIPDVGLCHTNKPSSRPYMDSSTLRSVPVVHSKAKPIRSYSEDDAPTLKLTLYPRITDNTGNQANKPSSQEELRVKRQPQPSMNPLHERQSNASPTSVMHSFDSPALRYAQDSREMERRAAVKRREYANQGSANSWSHPYSPSEPQYHLEPYSVPHPTLTKGYPSHTRNPKLPPTTRVYSLAEDPAGSPNSRSYYDHDPSRSRSDPSRFKVNPVVREIPVRVINSPSTYDRATPAPATFDIRRSTQRYNLNTRRYADSRQPPPPELQPLRYNFSRELLDKNLQRQNFWL